MSILSLENRQLDGEYRLHVKAKQRSYVEQKYFELYILNGENQQAEPPLFRGIHSSGRASLWVKGWVDGEYFEQVAFPHGAKLHLTESGLDVRLFKLLGSLIPLGGSLMVAYEMFWGKSQVHRETSLALKQGIPPLLTPLGYLLFQADCWIGIKDWYWPEGGMEGPPKLQGFKAPDEKTERKKTLDTIKMLENFLRRQPESISETESAARRLAEKILSRLLKRQKK
ncbi:DUF1122 family protein [Candidatus Hecatella orcuttiae]|uniref:DUF1122 family protein n=1 Tax=Candidatus Hecatella orcuttiae TaxID=1935119 RepID=UPI002867BF49|nr:DUF1122 family protein [Candidatus Hecatella orcuttiae]